MTTDPPSDPGVSASRRFGFYADQTTGSGQTNGCSECPVEYSEYVVNLNEIVESGGEVLVYVRFDDINSTITQLPARGIGLSASGNALTFSGSPGDFSISSFRYILIPHSVLAQPGAPDLSNYNSVVSYFRLSEKGPRRLQIPRSRNNEKR